MKAHLEHLLCTFPDPKALCYHSLRIFTLLHIHTINEVMCDIQMIIILAPGWGQSDKPADDLDVCMYAVRGANRVEIWQGKLDGNLGGPSAVKTSGRRRVYMLRRRHGGAQEAMPHR